MEDNKPNFKEATYWDALFSFTHGNEDRAAMRAAQHVWEKFVTPLQSENASLREQLENHRANLKAAKGIIDSKREEIASLRSSLSEKEAIIESNCNSYKEQLNDAHIKLAEKEKEIQELKASIQYYYNVLSEVRGKDWCVKPDHVLQRFFKALPPNPTEQ